MAAHFSPEALRFLRGVARHNDREWFLPRKATYERVVKQPMLETIAEVSEAMLRFAPEHVRAPEKILMRVYRDTRFSADKRPYKTNVAGWWLRTGLEKTSGAGFYFHVSAKETVIAAGAFMPSSEQLLAMRRHIERHPAELRRLLAGKRLRAAMAEFEGAKLTRAPRGFAADSPALDLLVCRQWGVKATLPAEAATQEDLVREIVTRFRLAAPVVEFLNAGILQGRRRASGGAEDGAGEREEV